MINDMVLAGIVIATLTYPDVRVRYFVAVVLIILGLLRFNF